MKTPPEEVVHGRPLAKDEKTVLVKKVYPHGSADDDEFVEGAFLRVKKYKLKFVRFVYWDLQQLHTQQTQTIV